MNPNAPFHPTEEQRKMVEMLSAMGVKHEDICKLILGSTGNPIDDKTLRKHFREELDTAAVKANQKVAAALFRKATDPDGGSSSVTAAIFWLKTRAGWKETAGLEVSGPDGGPVPTQVTAIRRTIIDPRHSDPEDIPPAP
ncbi:MAG: hypothetical protein ACP5D5_09440 [Acidithiobacillus sp.]|uniref:hypothetical protein n=1 Tax=Acidithiobacillus sp. TaxID=1872118 RepID=UPI003CFD28F2